MHQTFSWLEKLQQFIKIATPVTLTQFSLIGTSFIAVFLTGQYSTVHLAGLSIGYNIWISCFFGLMGIQLGITPIIAQLLGANKKEDIPRIIWQGFYLATIFGAVLITLGYISLDAILNILRVEQAAREVTRSYMTWVGVAMIPMLWMVTLRYVIDSHGKTFYTMAVMLSSMVLGAILNYSLILGNFGFPALGGIGAGITLATVTIYTVICYALIVHFNSTFREYSIFKQIFSPSWTHIREQLRLGIPIGISIFSEISIFSVAGLLMARFGTEIIAAHQAAISFTNIFYCFPLSISMASTIVVSFEIGAQRMLDAKHYAHLARIVAIVIAALICLYSFTHIRDIANLYTNDVKMIKLIESFVSYAVFFTVIDAFGTPIQGILRAYRDVNSISLISLITYWGVSLPVAYVFLEYFNYGPYAIWMGLLSAITVASIAFIWRLWIIQYKRYPIGSNKIPH